MTLRTRLFLAFLAVVSLVAGVAWIAWRSSRQIEQRVSAITGHSAPRLLEAARAGIALEVEGVWTGSAFVAAEIEHLPARRRPKFRGPIDGVDVGAGVLYMYGRAIRVDSTTHWEGGATHLAGLRARDRIEVSCRYDDARRLVARRIRIHGIKSSDKVKGEVEAASIDGEWPDTIVVGGVVVLVGREHDRAETHSPFYRLSLLTAIDGSVRDLGIVTHADSLRAVAARLDRYARELEESAAASQSEFGFGPVERDRWVDPICAVLRGLARDIRSAAQDDSVVVNRVRNRAFRSLMPLVSAYRAELEEVFAEEVRDVVLRSQAASRKLIAAGAASLLLAMLLGVIVWRSVARPIDELREAAGAIASGRMDTRVPVRTNDEIGQLAESFNRMARNLEESTVSIESLHATQRQLERSLREKDVLLREVHHRVKNNLQIITSLFELQAAHVNDPAALDGVSAMRERIRALALIHEQLYRATDADRVDFRTYLESLGEGLARSIGDGAGVTLHVEADPVGVDLDRAVSCGLIVNELVTNAIKHAFPDRHGGTVAVTLRGSDDGECELSVRDDGVGIASVKSEGDSLGADLVTALVEQIGGRIEVESGNGTCTTIRFSVRGGRR